MLYHLYEAQRASLAPWRFAAEQGQTLLSHSLNPLSETYIGRVMAATFDLFEHTTRRYGKPAFGITSTLRQGRTVAVREENIARKPFGQLKHFVREEGSGEDPKVLVVAPMSGHFATLLRGTVTELVKEHDVYITDWRNARMVPLTEGGFDLDDYIDYIIDWLSELGPNTHVVAVCQPAVPVTAAISIMSEEKNPATPPTFTLMGGPIDTRIARTEVNKFAERHGLEWYESHALSLVPAPHPGMMRRVYPGFMQLAGFMAMNFENHLKRHYDLFYDLVKGDGESAEATRAFYEEYRAVMDLPAEFYMQTLDVVFVNHRLPRGIWESRGRRIDPAAIEETAVFCIEGENDDITGAGQTCALLDLTKNLPSSAKAHYVAPGVGHYGVFNGRVWRQQTAPRVTDFIRAHSGR